MKPGPGTNAGASSGTPGTTSAVTPPSAVKREPTTPKDKATPPDVKPAVASKCLLLYLSFALLADC